MRVCLFYITVQLYTELNIELSMSRKDVMLAHNALRGRTSQAHNALRAMTRQVS